MKVGENYRNWTRDQVVKIVDFNPSTKMVLYEVIQGNSDNPIKRFWNPYYRFKMLYSKTK